MTATARPVGVAGTAGADGEGGAVEVVEVPVPVRLRGPEAWAVHGTVAVDRAVVAEIYGHTDLATDPDMVVSTMTAQQQYARVVRLVAVAAGTRDVLGRAMVRLPQQSNTHSATVYVGVDPAHRGRGVGGALWNRSMELVRAAGRRVVLADSSFAAEPPPGPGALEAPTGSGRVPREDPTTRFALARGFVLEQVVRHSVLELPVDPARLDRLRDGAPRRHDDYALHVWHDEVPEKWIEQFAVLETRMSTDAPSAGLEVEEDPWDAERVRDASRAIHDRGRRYLIVVAEHTPSGTLAAFSMVSYPLDRPEVVYQEDTLVLREHRGRRLGMLVKIAVLDELARARPAARRVHTWNAEENEHMLAINVALGFAPAGVDAEWQLRLTSSASATVDPCNHTAE
ncbi:GNAT family N-acetyltransferase [Oerskovia flava]|uniref:GNAT family N-acetyltransferase n=1 Tax=Oerskovia flava TaxID=2986422 RepID=UPI0022402372|nr:GNAT family N-acetyltransferase [Oerskovia sp. JB1-3-2]